MKRKIFKAVIWATIEDYARFIDIPLEIYNEIDEKYDDKVIEIAKKILLFYLEEDYVSLFYEKLSLYNNSEFIEIPKDKAKELIPKDLSWEDSTENILITASATKKGEELYYSGKIMEEDFKIPEIL